MNRWEPLPRPENPDLEAVRKIAVELTLDTMHFHEMAMAEPFAAERWIQERGKRLIELVGWPEGFTQYIRPAQNTDTSHDET